MGNQHTVIGNFDNALGNFMEFRRRFQHGIIDAREFNNERLNGDFRIHQANKLVGNFMAVELINGNLGDAFLVELAASSFYI